MPRDFSDYKNDAAEAWGKAISDEVTKAAQKKKDAEAATAKPADKPAPTPAPK